MRIAIFSDNFYPELSGVSDSIITTGKELARRGHKIHFYVPKYTRADYEAIGVKTQEIDLGPNVQISRFSSFGVTAGSGHGRAVIPTGLRWLSVRKFNPDIIHAHLFWGVGLEALAAAKKLKKPLVGTNHTALKEFMRYSPIKSARLTNLLLKYVNWFYGKCAITSAPSQSVISEMRELGFKGKGVVVSNPIDTNIFKPLSDKTAFKKKFGLSDQTVVYAGRLAEEKNIDVTIRAVAALKTKLPGLLLALAGSGPATDNLKKLATSLGVSSQVKFLGFMNQPTLAEVYNGSEIFVITSTSDTQGMTMMQAMACNLPVVGADARGIPEYINPQNGFLVRPGDFEAASEKIEFLFRGVDERKRLGAGAFKFAQQFSVPQIADRWEEIYEKTIKDYNQF